MEPLGRVSGGFNNDTVFALAVFDDGSGPALFVAGTFTSAAGVPVERIAKWDGKTWSAPVGGGFNNECTHLYVSSAPTGNPRLYASGAFTTAGGSPAPRAAVYDGKSWSAIPGLTFGISGRFVEFDDPSTPASDLYIAPDVSGVFRWDGTSMLNIAPGGIAGGGVMCMTVFDDGSGPALCLGGSFTSVDGVPAKRLATWSGNGWSELGGGVEPPGGTGQSWIRSMFVFDDGNGPGLYVSGVGVGVPQVTVKAIARWNGQSWSPLAQGLTHEARSMTAISTATGDCLVVAGPFDRPAPGLSMWNGTRWHAIGQWDGLGIWNLPGRVFDFEEYATSDSDPLLVACGRFQTAGGSVVSGNGNIAGWDGEKWQPIGVGFNGDVLCGKVFDNGSGAEPQLFVGGLFNRLSEGNRDMERVARWDGAQWHNVPGGGIGPRDMLVLDDGTGPALYLAGGAANSPSSAGRVTKWDGKSWNQIGPDFARTFEALEVFDDGSGPALYVGGLSSVAGGGNTLHAWDGSNWSLVGGGLTNGAMDAAVYDLKVVQWNGKSVLAVGGRFSMAGTLPCVGLAFWDGLAWIAPPASAHTQGVVRTILVHDDGTGPALFVAGRFAGGSAIQNIAKVTEEGWAPLAYGLAGLDNEVYCLASFDVEGGSSLFAGGPFDVAAGPQPGMGIRSHGIARWHTCLTAPIISSGPADATGVIGETISLSVQATGGDLQYRWRKDGVLLNNNAQQTDVASNDLNLFDVDASDAGEYDVVIENGLGNVTSGVATVTISAPCIGDITGSNGQVDADDLVAVILAWGPCASCSDCPADVDDTCAVDADDLVAVILNWGPCQ
jgi:hypothetical protein